MMISKVENDYAQEAYPKPDDQVIEKITNDLADHFPWPREDWQKFIRRVLIDGAVPHQMNSDDRLRYYMVVAEAISVGEFHHIPYINGNFPKSDCRRFFETISVGLDPEGKNEETVCFTQRLLSRTFKEVTVLNKEGQKQDSKNLLHLILTTRDERAVRNDFRALFNSSGRVGTCDGPMIVQLPACERPEIISRSALAVIREDTNTPLTSEKIQTLMEIALSRALKVNRKREDSSGQTFKVNSAEGKVKYRICEDDGQDVQVARVGEEELDILPIQKFPEAFMYALLFPTTTSLQFLDSLEQAHTAPENIFKPLLNGGWLIREIAPILSGSEDPIPRTMLATLQYGFSPYNYGDPHVLNANRARQFALRALAVGFESRKDHPKFQSVVREAETLVLGK